MVFLERKALFLVITFVFAIVLCGAVAAAAPNGASASKSVVSAVHGKDLVVNSVIATKISAKGQKISVKSTIKNQGNKAVSNGFYTYFYMVPIKSIVGYKKYIGKQYIPSLSAGKSNTQISYFTVPVTLKSGYYYIAAKTDASWTVHEANEGNNIGYTTTKTFIYPKKIDSGVSKYPYYTKTYWVTYLDSRNFVIIYTHFYNTSVGRTIYQKHTLGLWNSQNFPPNCMYYSVVPKGNGQSSYLTVMGGVTNISPQKYYWTLFRPDLVSGSLSH